MLVLPKAVLFAITFLIISGNIFHTNNNLHSPYGSFKSHRIGVGCRYHWHHNVHLHIKQSGDISISRTFYKTPFLIMVSQHVKSMSSHAQHLFRSYFPKPYSFPDGKFGRYLFTTFSRVSASGPEFLHSWIRYWFHRLLNNSDLHPSIYLHKGQALCTFQLYVLGMPALSAVC